jgi:predicted nucleic acid-binding protein
LSADQRPGPGAESTHANPLLVDTSAALALVDPDHVCHERVKAVVAGRRLGLAGHAAVEFVSVLTRLPAPKRLSPSEARQLAAARFPERVFLGPDAAGKALDDLARLEIAGGAVYDALVAVAAKESGLTLVTCDLRARRVYDLLGVDYLSVVSTQ